MCWSGGRLRKSPPIERLLQPGSGVEISGRLQSDACGGLSSRKWQRDLLHERSAGKFGTIGRPSLRRRTEGRQGVLDFNTAENPLCAFTQSATCSLPPKGNRLEVEIKAGEKRYKSNGLDQFANNFSEDGVRSYGPERSAVGAHVRIVTREKIIA